MVVGINCVIYKGGDPSGVGHESQRGRWREGQSECQLMSEVHIQMSGLCEKYAKTNDYKVLKRRLEVTM